MRRLLTVIGLTILVTVALAAAPAARRAPAAGVPATILDAPDR